MPGRVTGWVGWIWFAGLLAIVGGVLNIIWGIAAIAGPDKQYLEVNQSLVIFDVQKWGWIHLILGILLVVVGGALLAGQLWARVVAIIIVALDLITQFVVLPAQPWWSLVVIVLDLFVLWALIVHGDEVEEVDGV